MAEREADAAAAKALEVPPTPAPAAAAPAEPAKAGDEAPKSVGRKKLTFRERYGG
jgi:hypothetical protein